MPEQYRTILNLRALETAAVGGRPLMWLASLVARAPFAVLVEGGGLGADSAGPVANAFLRKL